MKKLLFLLIATSSFGLYAQETSTALDKAIRLIKATGADNSFEDAVVQIGAMVPEKNKAAYMAEAKETFTDIYHQLGAIYAEELTEAEMDEIISFYESDLGKKLASKQALLAQKGMAIGQTWGMKVGQIAQKYAKN